MSKPKIEAENALTLGEKKSLIKPEKNMGIFIKESVFKQLNAQKKQQNAKSWNTFFVDILGTK
jgi:hypothetical protein